MHIKVSMTPFVWRQQRNRTDLSLFCPMFCIWHHEKYQQNIATDISTRHSWLFDTTLKFAAIQLLLQCGKRNIYNGTIKGLDISAIFGVRYTDLRGLPSGILFRRVWSLIKYRTTENSTRCPLPPKFGPVRPDYVTIKRRLLKAAYSANVLLYENIMAYLFYLTNGIGVVKSILYPL